jgi:hypothetical protein
MRNRIINGAMVIDQRNAGSSISVGSSKVYPVDRFEVRIAQGSGHTTQRSTTAPAGFINSLLVTVGTGAAPTSGQVSILNQQIEGFNMADLDWGTASAKTITISFWARASVTGTYSIAISNNGLDRSYVTNFTISAANTFEYKTVTIAGDTGGTWLKNNAIGAFVFFDLGSGTNREATAGSWVASWSTRTAGSVQLAATSGATLFVTGIQFEVGTQATSFEYRQYQQELALCQRYFEKSYNANVAIGTATANGRTMIITGTATNNAIARSIDFCVEKRTAPTMTTWDANGNSGRITTFAADTVATENVTPSVPFGEISTKAARIGNAGTSRSGFAFSWAASSEL